ncbi:hypothetical protein [Halocatena marina]|uniref:hypothetical protein n=1 Tax=Halocatena marina TaxID=2934937 RepID=UPI00200E4809|nr:hypothetical protein [Halocatena marina]
MTERRISYHDLEDGIATLKVFEDSNFQGYLHWNVEELPDEAEPGDQYRPEFEDGELVALQYDKELTDQKWEDFEESREWLEEMRDK